MFDIGWTELLVIAVVAIVIIGPKDLPAALRAFGRFTGKMKRMARDFQGQFNEALREAELDTVAKEVKEIGRIDPMADLRRDLNKTHDEIRTGLNKPVDTDLMQLKADKAPDEPAPVVEPKQPDVAAAPALAAPPVPPAPAAVAEAKP